MKQELIRLRTLVGFLGEEDQFSWWDTSFLSETGQRFLERTFPRSAFASGLYSVTVAARQLHDASVGKGDVAHLSETALESLNEMSRVVSSTAGAVRVGRRDDLLTSDGIGQVAGYYHEAFTSDQQVFPYFSDA